MKSRPFHPILFALYPLISLYGPNMSIIPPGDLIRPGLIMLACVAVLWMVSSMGFRNIASGAAATSITVFSLVSFGHVWATLQKAGNPPDTNLFCITWLVITLAAAVFGGRASKGRPNAAYFPNLVGSFLMVLALGAVGMGYAKLSFKSAKVVNIEKGTAHVERPPDIFYIILDGYGRQDQLRRVMGFDNASFIQALKDRGFYIADQSHSNYCQTELSVCSSLNMEMLPSLFPEIPTESTDRGPIDNALDHNRLAAILKREGYLTVGVTSGFPSIHVSSTDLQMTHDSGLTLLESTLLEMTPFQFSDGVMETQHGQKRTNLKSAVSNLISLSRPTASPRFVFAHLLCPHPAFVFKPDGSELNLSGVHGDLYDGSDFMEHGGTHEKYRQGYVSQVQWLNSQVLRIVDALQKRPGPPPIIVLQGDHGSKLGLDQNLLAKTDIQECFSNLACFYVPENIREKLYPTVTPVNEFRIITATLFNLRLPLLPDRSFYSGWTHPFSYQEVTSRLDQGQGRIKAESGSMAPKATP